MPSTKSGKNFFCLALSPVRARSDGVALQQYRGCLNEGAIQAHCTRRVGQWVAVVGLVPLLNTFSTRAISGGLHACGGGRMLPHKALGHFIQRGVVFPLLVCAAHFC